jgi:hypothetical protein
MKHIKKNRKDTLIFSISLISQWATETSNWYVLRGTDPCLNPASYY